MGNGDSLGYIISDFQMELDNYLEENGLSTNSLVIFTGAWIESMHLAMQSVTDKPNAVLMSRLIEQKKILHDLIEILDKEEKDAELDILMAGLVKISENFSSYDVESMENEEDLASLTMTKEQVVKLAMDVEETRKFIING
jgi:hypothetical protein